MLPHSVHLSRRGELLRAVSHAIRCLNQVPKADLETWRRDARRFRESILSQYSDVAAEIPPEFDRWTAIGETGIRDERDDPKILELLERLPDEIRKDNCT